MLAATVTIGVFGLFHPHALDIAPWGPSRIALQCAHRTLEGASARFRIITDCTATGNNGGRVDFLLVVPPNRIQRHFHGTLRVTRQADGELIAAVTMPLEVAVASTVAAESPANAAATMLEAQAIVTRSYFSASPRHTAYDFCDTTHCQFLKEPPSPASPAARAAHDTTGRVLFYRERIIAAFYSAKCDNQLAPLPASQAGAAYPYFAVKCDYCARNPSRAAPKANARPHHHGLCQLGAQDMAQHGSTAAQILAHYYPGAELR